MALYLLTRHNDRGEEVFVGTFDDEQLLLQAIEVRRKLVRRADGGFEIEVESDGYRVREIAAPQPEVDLPDVSYTVPSYTRQGVTYGLAVKDGNVVGCTCPDFVYTRAKAGVACKHMIDEDVYGVNVLEGASFPGVFFTRF